MIRSGRLLFTCILAVGLTSAACAQPGDELEAAPTSAPPGVVAIPLYGRQTPGKISDEIISRFRGRETVVRNVTYPTVAPVLPRPGTANGTAVIVAPGGGFSMLAIQNEGWRVAQALADRGVTAFLLKYRLNPTPKSEKDWVDLIANSSAAARQRTGKGPSVKDPSGGDDVKRPGFSGGSNL